MTDTLKQYCIDYVCSYHEYTDKEDDYYVNMRYHLDFLKIFGQTVYDDDAIDNILDAIYETFKDNAEFNAILNAIYVAENFDRRAPRQWALLLCYSYAIMYAMHPFVSYLIIHKDTDDPYRLTLECPEYRRLYDGVAAAIIHRADSNIEADENI